MIKSESNVILSIDGDEPVTVDYLMTLFRAISEDDRTIFDEFIPAARLKFEDDSGTSLIQKTFRHRLLCFPPERFIELPSPPLTGVTSITYIDVDGNSQPWPTDNEANWILDTDRTPGVIWLGPDASWPATRRNHPRAVEIEYTAGLSWDEVPANAKTAVAMLCGHWHSNPEATSTERMDLIPEGYWNLVESIKETRYP